MNKFPVNKFLFQFHADNSKNYNYEVFGAELCQNALAIQFLSRILEELRPTVIIEIGTYTGGLSILFGQYGFLKKIPVHTFDIVDKRQNAEIFEKLGINFHLQDCFSETGLNFIKSLIQNNQRVLLFCDGGDKIKEFNTFSDFIKDGDIICCHDFALNENFFKNEIYLKWWGWHEISLKDIEGAINKNNLKQLHLEVASACAIGMFGKKG